MPKRIKNDPIINKKAYKASVGKCRICGLEDKSVLDVHRILPGSEGGKYTKLNSTCICSNCHRKVHDGKIEIIRYFSNSYGGKSLLIKDEHGERFV
jgi:predicted HNH restriction endonuclease